MWFASKMPPEQNLSVSRFTSISAALATEVIGSLAEATPRKSAAIIARIKSGLVRNKRIADPFQIERSLLSVFSDRVVLRMAYKDNNYTGNESYHSLAAASERISTLLSDSKINGIQIACHYDDLAKLNGLVSGHSKAKKFDRIQLGSNDHGVVFEFSRKGALLQNSALAEAALLSSLRPRCQAVSKCLSVEGFLVRSTCFDLLDERAKSMLEEQLHYRDISKIWIGARKGAALKEIEILLQKLEAQRALTTVESCSTNVARVFAITFPS